MPFSIRDNQQGYSLVEVIIVVLILGIIAGIAVRSLSSSSDVSRTRETVAELDRIAHAIAGDPDRLSGGVRVDYGYVGDVGALPGSLDALLSNPGGYGTWSGPYLQDELTAGAADYMFKLDAWGQVYTYTGGNTIASSGGGSPITRQIARSVDDLLYNRVSLAVTDIDNVPPGPTYADSLAVVLVYPDGSGAYATRSRSPDPNGLVEFDSIPIGLHRLQVVYIPEADTLTRRVPVDPGRGYYTEIHLNRELW
jgi:prepilin-type N-terminal cleavage/methylation domain-containing protein